MKLLKNTIKIIGLTILATIIVIVGFLVFELIKSDYKTSPERYIGKTICMGRYKYRADTKRDWINWLVVDVVDDKLVLISEDIIEYLPFESNGDNNEFIWKKTNIREFLNSDFLSNVLSDCEDEIYPINPYSLPLHMFESLKKERKEDKVFLMNVYLADTFNKEQLKAKPSDYVVSKGFVVSDDGFGNWWLIPPENTDDLCAYVDTNGDIQYVNIEDVDIENSNIGIRPMFILEYYGTGRFYVWP